MTPNECLNRLAQCKTRAEQLAILNEFYLEAVTFDPALDVELFHKKFGINYEGKPRILEPETLLFRLKFMREEMQEFEDAMIAGQNEIARPHPDHAEITYFLDKALDGLVDMSYVVYGTAHLAGLDMREGHRRVHEANMRKVRAEDHPRTGESRFKLKIVKPEGWQPPDHKDLVEDHAHRGPREGL